MDIGMARDIKTKDGTLNEFEKGFILALVENGGNMSAAARSAGYTGANPSAKGKLVMAKPGVQALVKTATQEMLGGTMALEALATVRNLARGGKSESVRLRAAEVVLERAGVQAEGLAVAQVGSVVINLNYQEKTGGTRGDVNETDPGVQKQGGTVTHTPSPLTGDDEIEAEYVEIDELKEQ
jgi:hypothetical protein